MYFCPKEFYNKINFNLFIMKKLLTLFIILAGVSFGSIASASLWSYYNEQGLNLPSVKERKADAMICGIDDYVGSYAQNIALE